MRRAITAPILLMVGYANNPKDFAAQLPEFERFASLIDAGEGSARGLAPAGASSAAASGSAAPAATPPSVAPSTSAAPPSAVPSTSAAPP